MFFFQGLFVLLNRFLNGAWCFVDCGLSWLGINFCSRGRCCLGHFSNDCFSWRSSGSQFGFLLQALFFTLATTHFTRVVRCAATWCQGVGRSGSNHWCRHFGNYRRFHDRSRLGCCDDRLGGHCIGNRSFNRRSFNDWRWSFGYGWLGNPVERGLLFASFTNGFGHGFSGGFDNRLCNHDRLFNHRLYVWCLCHFDFRRCGSFDRGSRFNDWRFDWSGFQGGGSGAFGLLVGLCFGRGADHGAGNGCGNSQAGGEVGGAWCFIAFAGFGFFRTFDHIAVGIALTLATVAATTLATGTAARTIAFGAILTFFLQLLFVGGQLFFGDGSGLFGTGLTLFTRWAWSTFFAWRAGRALFSGRRSSRGSRSSIQRLTQFTNALFAFATWLTVFTRCARCTFFSWSTRCAFFTCYGWCLFTGFAWLTLFAWLT